MQRKRIAIGSVLIFLLLLSVACKDQDLNTAAKNVNIILKSVQTATTTTIQAYNQGLLTREEVVPIETICKKVTLAANEANNSIINLNKLDPTVRVNLFQIIDPIFKSFDSESLAAISGIKNPQKKQELQIILGSIQASLAVLDATFAK